MNEIGKDKDLDDFNNGFSSVNSKRLKSKFRKQGKFKITTSNKFDCLSSWPGSDFNFDSLGGDCGLVCISDNHVAEQ